MMSRKIICLALILAMLGALPVGHGESDKPIGERRRSSLAAGFGHTVGLKADGTAVAVGYIIAGQCEAEGWTNIQVP